MSFHGTLHIVIFGHEVTITLGVKTGNRHPGR